MPTDLLSEIKQLEAMFVVSQAELKHITNHFVQELEKGVSFAVSGAVTNMLIKASQVSRYRVEIL